MGVFSATWKTIGYQTLTAADTATANLKTTSNTIVVIAAAATHLGFVGTPSSTPAGTSFHFTVDALDSFGNIANGYMGTVHFTSNDSQAVLPADATLTLGVATFSATLATGGSLTLAASDKVANGIAGTSPAIVVNPVAATHFVVMAPTTATAGSAATVTVIAEDQFNNLAPSYQGTIHFTSSDPNAVLPANATLSGGLGTFNVTLKTAHGQTVSVADVTSSGTSGTSQPIIVSPLAATHFGISAQSAVAAGDFVTFSVTALDQFNNTATGYSGTVHFSSTDGQALLPLDKTLTGGTGLFGISLRTAGNQSISASYSSIGRMHGISILIVFAAGAVNHLHLSGPASAISNASFLLTVTAQDTFGNSVIGYSGSLHFASSDTAAVLPANASVTGGVGTFTVTLKTGGQPNHRGV